ncbi:MAG: hypothetical protein ACE361_18355 [Aureliella sp.]
MFQAAVSVFRFELRRSVTLGRILVWVALCLFPPLLVATMRVQSRGQIPDEVFALICYVLVPQVSCMLGLLLWATPAVGTELEAQSWVNLIMREKGRIGVALGKYAVAVVWTASYGIVSAVLVSTFAGTDETLQLMLGLSALVVFSSLAYAALYLMIGTAFFRRATIAAVVYSLILEGLISWIPATINQATVSYRLRTLLADWTCVSKLRDDLDMAVLFGDEPTWVNILVLLAYALVFLGLSAYFVQTREYPVQNDS